MTEIFRLNLNNADFGRKILIIGVIHGDEPNGEYFIKEFLKDKKNFLKNVDSADITCKKTNNDEILHGGKNDLYFIPRLNPANTRKNINGVDLNRNFKTKNWEQSDPNSDYFGGFEPNSEEETKFVVNLMENVRFDAVVTIHAPYKVVNFDSRENKEARKLAEKISEILDYPVEEDIGYLTPGSFGTYSGVERNIPTITIEYDENEPKEELYLKFKNLFEFLAEY